MADSVFMVLSVSSLLLSEKPIKARLRLGKLVGCCQYNSADIVCTLDTSAGLTLTDRSIGIQLISPGKAQTLSHLQLNTIQEVKQLNWNDKTVSAGAFRDNSANQEGS